MLVAAHKSFQFFQAAFSILTAQWIRKLQNDLKRTEFYEIYNFYFLALKFFTWDMIFQDE